MHLIPNYLRRLAICGLLIATTLSSTICFGTKEIQEKAMFRFVPSTAQSWTSEETLDIEIIGLFNGFLGNIQEGENWKKYYSDPYKAAHKVCLNKGKFEEEVIIERVYGSFGQSCKVPKLKLSFAQKTQGQHKRELLKKGDGQSTNLADFFRAKEVYIILPCVSVDSRALWGSTDPKGAGREVRYEYLLHRLFADMGFPSFKVRPVRLSFQESLSQGTIKKRKLWGFAMESGSAIAERHSAELIEESKFAYTNRSSLVVAKMQMHLFPPDDHEIGAFLNGKYSWVSLINSFFFSKSDFTGFYVFFDLVTKYWDYIPKVRPRPSKVFSGRNRALSCKIAKKYTTNRIKGKWTPEKYPLKLIPNENWQNNFLERIDQFYEDVSDYYQSNCLKNAH